MFSLLFLGGTYSLDNLIEIFEKMKRERELC